MPDEPISGYGAAAGRSSSTTWRSSLSATLNTIKPPLPGFPELKSVVKSLLDDLKAAGYDDKRFALLSRRLNCLADLLHDFENHPHFSEISRRLCAIKQRFETEYNHRSRLVVSNEGRRQHVLDELYDEMSVLIEETQMRMLHNHAVGLKNPVDNFPILRTQDITQCKLGYYTLGPWRSDSTPDYHDGVIIRTRHGRVGNLSVTYRTYRAQRDSDKASKAAERDLKYLDSFDHANIASIIGITKGYHGINGIVFTTGGLTLPCFLSRVNTGSALVRCFRGLEEAHKYRYPTYSQLNFYYSSDVTVGLNGHSITCFRVTNESSWFPQRRGKGLHVASDLNSALISIIEVMDLATHPATRLASEILSIGYNDYGISKRNDLLDCIVTLGLMRFTEMEVGRIAVRHKLRPARIESCGWGEDSQYPPFTIGLGDIGFIDGSNLVLDRLGGSCIYLTGNRETRSSWNPVHQVPRLIPVDRQTRLCERFSRDEQIMGYNEIEVHFTTNRGWYSCSLPQNPRSYYLKFDWKENASCYNEEEIKARLARTRLLKDVDKLYYCYYLRCHTCFKDSRSGASANIKLYFHRKPSSRSNPREFWGFVSTNLDPYADTIGIDEGAVEVTYNIDYRAYSLREMWSLKYERMIQNSLASIPGGYPGSHVEEV